MNVRAVNGIFGFWLRQICAGVMKVAFGSVWQMSILLLGSSHARRFKRRLREGGYEARRMSAEGIPGCLLSSEAHTARLLRIAKARKPEQVVLMLGGNDLSSRDFDLPHLSGELHLLGLGLAALGVKETWILPILPRKRTRCIDVSPQRYEERRLATNRIWATRFRHAPVTMINMDYPEGALGHDGVHMSERGELAVYDMLMRING